MKAAKTKEVIRWATVGEKTKEESWKKEFGEILTLAPGGFVSPCEIHAVQFLFQLFFLRFN